MSSILTNTSAMTALQTLKSINNDLATVQDQVSTGFKVGTAKDNAAIFAISQVMRSDVKGFEAISDSLSLGLSTVSVASSGAAEIGELLDGIKEKIVAATGENIDRDTLQNELVSLRDQISGIVDAAQFNGLNFLKNNEIVATGDAVSTANIVGNKGSGTVSVLASLDRAPGDIVSTSSIDVGKQDLSTTDAVQGTGTDLAATAVTGLAAIAAGASGTFTVAGDTAAARGGNAVLAGDSYTITGFTGVTEAIRYVAKDGDTVEDIAAGLSARINFFAEKNGVAISATVSGVGVTVTNNTTASITTAATLNSGGTASGGLELLGDIDISTEEGAAAALGAIESLIQSTTDSQAVLGTSENRIEIQNDFMSKLIDAFESGIGALVDADMEEAAARLQALQVQQQLGTQALSIANSAPQSILSLFK